MSDELIRLADYLALEYKRLQLRGDFSSPDVQNLAVRLKHWELEVRQSITIEPPPIQTLDEFAQATIISVDRMTREQARLIQEAEAAGLDRHLVIAALEAVVTKIEKEDAK